MRYFCRVSYDGTGFSGWQRQPDMVTVQETLDTAAATVLRSSVKFTGAGRTDAGVHAEAMGVHFDYDGEIDRRKFIPSMNALLPQTVAIYGLVRVDEAFHARYSALSRTYRYTMTQRKSPLLRNRAWYVPYVVDWGKIMTQLTSLLGKHDFSAFCATGSVTATNDCTIFDTAIEQQGDCMIFLIKANRFLYNMVRSITGTLVEIGRGKQTKTLAHILESKDRMFAGSTAPASGLVLSDVEYAEEI